VIQKRTIESFVFFSVIFLIKPSFAFQYELDLKLRNKFLTEYSYQENVDSSLKAIVEVNGINRSYYRYLPKNRNDNTAVLITLHGAGRTGASMIDTWKSLADKYSIIIIAPNSINKKWNLKGDQHHFIQKIINKELGKSSMKNKKVYLFGHSNGAKLAMLLKIKEPEIYRAVVAHAGTLPYKANDVLQEIDPRKAEIAIFLGDSDHLFSVRSARKTINWLATKGVNSILYILKDHTHWYYHDAEKINEAAWKYLQQI
jgi:poly(3-hydroxybutyrate) depolymerase